jgi:septal ring factor EnvC (AmiA/AmiB activator)|tara:strand:- start:971 stop:2116 length:1146 start_codon:yes stop_codon:yes gene_type:complete
MAVSLTAVGQKNKKQLELERIENISKITEAEKILAQTKTKKKATLGQLAALENQIASREVLLKSLDEEVDLITAEILELEAVISDIDLYLKSLKDEYAAMIYKSYKSNNGYNIITFLFASDSFTQFYMRLKYMEQYVEARKIQSHQIAQTKQELKGQQTAQEQKKSDQQQVIKSKLVESNQLIKLKKEKSTLIAQLTKNERSLRKEMAARKQSIKKLDNLIANLIKVELERELKTSSGQKELAKELTGKFEDQMRKLPWPVKTGFISLKFGLQRDPILKNVSINNTGVDIQTQSDENIAVVFDGEVRIKAFVPGQNNVVIVKHGNYYTVYSKLKSVEVKQGQVLRAGDLIGKVHTNNAGISQLHFEVWRDKKKLDPERWLK